MSARVQVNTSAYATTHVATNMLRGLRQIIKDTGLSTTRMTNQWAVLETGVAAWLGSGHLKALTLEVFDPSKPSGADHVGRFDFTIDYSYYGDGDGELWLDPDTVAFAIQKNGSYPSGCDYRIVADTAAGYPAVPGWEETTLRSTAGLTRHAVGTAIGGGSIGAGLTYYTRSST